MDSLGRARALVPLAADVAREQRASTRQKLNSIDQQWILWNVADRSSFSLSGLSDDQIPNALAFINAYLSQLDYCGLCKGQLGTAGPTRLDNTEGLR